MAALVAGTMLTPFTATTVDGVEVAFPTGRNTVLVFLRGFA
jgi:hypothetical protein